MSIVLVTVLSSFLASAVEFVEALTVVLAAGITRQWRSTLFGAGAAVLTLAVLVGVFGTALVRFVPIELLRLLVGCVLLIFGLQWLTKAILRAAGARARRDEGALYAADVAELAADPPVPSSGMDWISFTVAFKGVLLEGLEVAFIVISFGSTSRQLGPAALGAAAAAVLVIAAGVLLRRPLARVPENGLKFVVGLMLTSFGAYWGGEGVGIDWPTGDLTILGLLVGFAVASLLAVRLVASGRGVRRAAGAA